MNKNTRKEMIHEAAEEKLRKIETSNSKESKAPVVGRSDLDTSPDVSVKPSTTEKPNPTLTPAENIPDENVPAEAQGEVDEFGEPVEPEVSIDVYYRMKILYTHYIAFRDILNSFSGEKIEEIKDKIKTSIDLLKDIVIPNMIKFNDRLDDIIEKFENFLEKSIDVFYKEVKNLED